MSNILQPIDNFLEDTFGRLLKQPVLTVAIIKFIIVLYAAHLAPLPPQVVTLVNNVYFKLLFFTIILWTAQLSPSTALLLSLAFVMTTNYASTGKMWEGYRNYRERLDGETPAMPMAPAAPAMPVTPAAPAMPMAPATPAMPVIPAAPVMPVTPAAPAMPVTPAAPAMPVTPAAQMGCYPMRQVNLEQVMGVPDEMLANFELTV